MGTELIASKKPRVYYREVTILAGEIDGGAGCSPCVNIEDVRLVRAVVAEGVRSCGGVEVSTSAGHFLAAFENPVAALRCAVGIQRALARRPRDGEPPHVGIGLHVGNVIRDGDGIFGRNVMLARRLASWVEGDMIIASAAFKERAGRESDVTFHALPADDPDAEPRCELYRIVLGAVASLALEGASAR